MARATRSFCLALSPVGMDLLIETHAHMIRATRSLLSWGATLHIAVSYLETLSDDDILLRLRLLPSLHLAGVDVHHVGAPNALADIAAVIVRRVGVAAGRHRPATLGELYLAALCAGADAAPESIRTVHMKMVERGTRPKFRTGSLPGTDPKLSD